MERRAKIVATLGPASADGQVLTRLIRAGLDVARLNLSHGDHESHRQLIRTVRSCSRALGHHVPVLLDLMGPRFRLGQLETPVPLERDDELTLGDRDAEVDLPVDGTEFLTYLRQGERILIDNGLVELRVLAKRGRKVRAQVVVGGVVSTRKGINLPDTEIPFSISGKDYADIAFAVTEKADYLAVSYVGSAADMSAVRQVVRDHDGNMPLVAKLERRAAIDNLRAIVHNSDAVMVARGDLGVEVPIDRVPVLQKRIVAEGRRTGTPVIVATQMLESMMTQPRPTRAEATDVANAVFDGTDALMLSGETAAGRYPVETVETMVRIIEQAEDYDREVYGGRPAREAASVKPMGAPKTPERALDNAANNASTTGRDPRSEIADVICASAVHAADQLSVGRIVAFSQGGFTARSIARYRPAAPILVFTTDDAMARQVQLVWGVRPLRIEGEVNTLDEMIGLVDRQLRAAKLAKEGDSIVLLMGDPIRARPLTNLMRIHRISACDERRSSARTGDLAANQGGKPEANPRFVEDVTTQSRGQRPVRSQDEVRRRLLDR